MATVATQKYQAMVGYLIRVRRGELGNPYGRTDLVPWPRALAWAICAYRTRFPNETAYLELARRLEADAKSRMARERRPKRRIVNAVVLPPALHIAESAMRPLAGGLAKVIEHEWLFTKSTGGVGQRVLGLRTPAPDPAPIGPARVFKAQKMADSQPSADNQPDAVIEPMPPLESLENPIPDAEPLHLLMPDAVAELRDTLNQRRL